MYKIPLKIICFYCIAFLLSLVSIEKVSGQKLNSASPIIDKQKQVPRFEAAECAVPIPKGERVDCRYLVVSESRSLKTNSIIRLPIIIMKSDSPNPLPDPILRTLGGPGGSSLRMITGRRFSPWLKNRNMIIFEQRGTKYSQPSLQCPEVDAANINSAKQNIDDKTRKSREVQAAKLCFNRLLKQGINLSAYNSTESAADIEDLRRVLKLDKINLYGISYSARLMLNVMRDYPAGIRSVTLESTMPLEINYDEVGVSEIIRSLNLLFAKCAANADCAGNYPKLESDFYELVKKVNVNPIVVPVKDSQTNENLNIRLNGYDIVTWLVDYLLSSDGRMISAAPSQIYQIKQGDYAPLKDYTESKISSSFYSWGMCYSVWCSEEMPFENRRKIAAQSNLYPQIKGYEPQSMPSICRVWKVSPAKKIENLPVKSNIPTLILGGEYDAYTPPDWGKIASKNLKNSFFFEVPWVGHGPGFNSPLCLSEMVANFFDNPASAPASGCLSKIENYFKFTVKSSK